MVVISEDYYTKEKIVKLTEDEIEKIIDALENVHHSYFVWASYDKIIDKLKEAKNG